MTAAALVGVGVPAAQAEAAAPKVRAPMTTAAATGKAASATESGSSSGSTTSTSTNSNALPANPGSGARIVYSPSTRRVWLVEDHGGVERTMRVVPGTITAPTGTYTVSAMSDGATGGDGVQVQYVVRFDAGGSTTYGFDAEAGITGLPPAPNGQTGGIRMAQTGAQALYGFPSVRMTVVVD